MPTENFKYCLEDYVFQNMVKDLKKRSLKQESEAVIWGSLASAYDKNEEAQINGTIKAFYAALNRKNFEDARVFWLPDDNSALIWPGYDPVVS